MLGQSAVVKLAGDTWEELLTVDRDMLHVSFPRVRNNDDDKRKPEAVDALHELLEDAREYDRLNGEAEEFGSRAPAFDPRLEALVPFARGEKQVALHADNAQTILYALQFAEDERLDVVLYGAREAWKVVDAIRAADVPVVTGPVLTLPSSEFDPYDSAYANPAVLQRAGIRFAIMPVEEANTRNACFHAGMAAAFGLPREEAVRSITYYPAQILGLEKDLGSLTAGKLADVVVTDGDLLQPTTKILHVLIDGEQIDVTNRQTELYDRYHDRLRRLQSR
jgi:imidazolonepropionase-like amidohydrolase